MIDANLRFHLLVYFTVNFCEVTSYLEKQRIIDKNSVLENGIQVLNITQSAMKEEFCT